MKKYSKKDFYLERGVHKLNFDLDVESMIRTIHNVDIMHATLFTEFEQLLLKFQRRLILHSSSDESEHDIMLAQKRQKAILNDDEEVKDKLTFKFQLNQQMQEWLST